MLTDEEKRAIRAKVSDASGEWHFDLMMYANEIERAALAKSGEQNYKQDIVVGEVYKSSSTGSSVDCTLFIDFPEGTTKLYVHPLPAQAIPEGCREVVEAVAHIGIDFGYGAFELSQEHIDKARALLSATPKP